MGKERPPPGRLAVAAGAGHHLPGQPPDGPAVAVDQPGLAGQAVAVLMHPDDIAVALPQAARGEHDQFRGMTEYLGDILAEPARRRAGVELGLHHDAARGQVQAAGKPQQRGYLSLPAAWLEHGNAAEFILHQAGQCHWPHSPSNICANAPASRRGSWRGDPSPMARSASTSLPPSRPAAFSSSAVVPAAAWRSASTTSIVNRGAWSASTSR